eukprot:8931735-Pyramimonas_sp.AAC.1
MSAWYLLAACEKGSVFVRHVPWQLLLENNREAEKASLIDCGAKHLYNSARSHQHDVSNVVSNAIPFRSSWCRPWMTRGGTALTRLMSATTTGHVCRSFNTKGHIP